MATNDPKLFDPPALQFEARGVFAQEYEHMFPNDRPAALDGAWRKFSRSSEQNGVHFTARVVYVLSEAEYRRAALSWCMHERANRAILQANALKEESKAFNNRFLVDLQEAVPNECIVLDCEHGCLRGHDCEQDHPGQGDSSLPIGSVSSGGLGGLLESIAKALSSDSVDATITATPSKKGAAN